jgi:hypothetical protein
MAVDPKKRYNRKETAKELGKTEAEIQDLWDKYHGTGAYQGQPPDLDSLKSDLDSMGRFSRGQYILDYQAKHP